MSTIITISTQTSSISITTDLLCGVGVGIPVRDHQSTGPEGTPVLPKPRPIVTTPSRSLPSQISPPMISATPCNANIGAFWLPGAIIKPIEIGNWVGSIAHGGANVNCNLISFCPHGCSTHTECLGHISISGTSVLDHCPTGIGPGVSLLGKTCTYLDFKKQFYPTNHAKKDYIDAIPVNECYQDDDVVIGDVPYFLQNLATIISSLQSLLPTISPSFQPFKILHHDNISLVDILDVIPDEILTVLRYFSSTLILTTFLPQVMPIYARNPSPATFMEVQHRLLESGDVQLDEGHEGTNIINYNNTNPPYIPSQFMTIITQLFHPSHFVSDLPSLDRENDGGMVLSHKVLFMSHYPQTSSHSNAVNANTSSTVSNDPRSNQYKPYQNPQQPLVLFNQLEAFYKTPKEPTPTAPTTESAPTETSSPTESTLTTETNDSDPNLTPSTIPLRTNTEMCWFPLPLQSSQHNGSQGDELHPPTTTTTTQPHLVLIDLRVAPIDCDAAPSMPIIYPVLACKML